MNPQHGARNVFGVLPHFGDAHDLEAPKWVHVARIKARPEAPAMTLRFGGG